MKKCIYFFAILFLFSSQIAVDAHSGRTDSSGGHNCTAKSVAKGLCTEYHYHNGGDSSATKSTTKPAEPVYNPQVYYDDGYNTGYAKGQSMGYKRDSTNISSSESNSDYLEGWSDGYSKGLEAGLAKIEKEEKEIKDKKDGEENGKKDGAIAFSNGKNIKEYTYSNGSSEIYINAYTAAFVSSWEIAEKSKESYETGYKQGLKLDEMTIPDTFKTEIFQVEYESGYNIGVKERDEKEIANYNKEGYTLGYTVSQLVVPEDIQKDIYEESFEEGYDTGLNKRREEVNEEGYNFAFKQIDYENITYKEQEQLSNWFKEGYESNKIAIEIKNNAKTLGQENDEYVIAEEYDVGDDAVTLYDSLFYEGQEIREEKKKKQRTTAISAGVIALPVLGGYYFWNRKRKKKID